MALSRPILIYDGNCPFCLRCVERAKFYIGDKIDYAPYQQAASQFPQVDPNTLANYVHFIEPDGKISRGAKAIFRSLALAGRYRGLYFAYNHVPLFAPIAEFFYNFVAAHRSAFDRLDRFLVGPSPEPSLFRLTRQLFLRLLGAVYLIAFVSLRIQIDGLVGSDGILPARSFLQAVHSVLGNQGYWQFPTLCWLNPSDAFLHLLCNAGAVASIFIILGIGQRLALVLTFACYLSLCVASQDFLEFQWDFLLLEAGFLAIFFAPMHPLAWRAKSEPSRAVLWLLRWLLFRLLFMSGVVKLASQDPNWRSLSALRYHYLTQPLPSWISWYFYQCPGWFQTFSCCVVFFVELLVPFLILTPRRPRLLAFWAILIFQFLIILTGNYGFFSLLAIALCCFLPDDRFWRHMLHLKPKTAKPFAPIRWRPWITLPLAMVLFIATLPICIDAFGYSIAWPAFVQNLQNGLIPFRIADGYGLFAVMTTQYKSIEIEGSDDGVIWKPYSFKFTPGDIHRRPEFITPYMPRLDWQMWFAALGDESENPWFTLFLNRLMQGSPVVLSLMETNPFPDHPPRYIRAILYEYKFTDFPTRRATGDWWTRSPIGIYSEVSAPQAVPQQ